MTVSFHKYTGDFFPGTGKLDDNGAGPGKHFCLNVPLKDGIDDEMYLSIFKSVIEDTVTAFRPTAIVLQCGADSLGCDRLGAFNLSIAAHGECVNFVRKFNVPLLVLGGGGYTIKNVSRCWTYETAVLVGASIPDELPRTIYDSFFRETKWKLHPPLTGRVENQNTSASLQRIASAVRTKLRYLQGAPSVQLQDIPPDLAGWLRDEERSREEREEDARGPGGAGETRARDRAAARGEFFDGERDNDAQTEPDEAPSTPAPATTRRGASAGRKPRGGRRGRGRGRGRPSAASIAESAAGEDDDDGEEPTPSARPTRAKRGRGRGRGRPSKAKERDTETPSQDETSMDVDPETLENSG